MTEANDTQEIPRYAPGGRAEGHRAAPAGPGPALRALRGFTGVLTGGLVALAVAVGVAQWLVASSGRPGLGTAVVAGHVIAALAAVVVQVVADRGRGLRAALACLAVLVIAAATLWFGWWA
jgi:hypothetical protein